MNYPEYENHKYSGSDLLGDVPNTWEVKKLKYVIKIIQTGTTPSTTDYSFYDGEINWFNPKDLNHEVLRNSEKKLTQNAIDKGGIKLFPGNSILIVGIGATTGKTSYLKHPATFNQQITGFKSLKHNNKYLFYLLKSMSGVFLKIANYTTLPILNNEFFKSFLLNIPPVKEQQGIVSFLDQKTSEIDALIAKKEKLIKLLEEKRTALITQVVTKGLDPNVLTKKPDLPWLKTIPSHWDVKKFQHTSYVKARIGWQNLRTDEFVKVGPYCVTGTDFINGKVNWKTAYHVSEERYHLDTNIQLRQGDLLITKDGTIGKLAILDELPDKSTLNSGVFVTRPLAEEYSNSFMYWVLSSQVFIDFIRFMNTGTTINHLYQHMLERFKYPLPPIDEQDKISRFLYSATADIDKITSKILKVIELIKEYRSALITSAVTGKIKVPNQEVLNEYAKSNESAVRSTG